MSKEDFKNFTNEEILNLLVDIVNQMESKSKWAMEYYNASQDKNFDMDKYTYASGLLTQVNYVKNKIKQAEIKTIEKVMNKINEAGYNEAPKFGPSQNNPPYISDDFQIGPNGAYEHNETIKIQQELIDVLYSQVIDLSMMSKIELGDDVIAEIKRLKQLINKQTR